MASPSPLQQLANLRPDIHEALTEFDLFLNQQRMIGLQMLPVIETELQAGSYPHIKIEALLRQVDTARASGGAYNFTEFDFEDGTFATKENGITVPTDNRNSAIYSLFGLELLAAQLARSTVLVNQEIRIANLLTNTATIANSAVTNGAWTAANAATATPINDVEIAVQALYDRGIVANCLAISWKTFRNLRNCEQIIDRINAHGAGSPAKPSDVNLQMLSACFDLDYIKVGGAQYNSANEGQPPVLSPIWPNATAVVARIALPGETFQSPAVGRTFHWGGDGSSIDGTFETYYDENLRGNKVRMRMETQELLTYPTAAQLITGVYA